MATSSLAGCCWSYLILGDLGGRDVAAQLLQRVDDLAAWGDGDGTREDRVHLMDAGILGRDEGTCCEYRGSRGR